MTKEFLKVKGKSRLYDDVKDGLIYKTTMTHKTGKKGEHDYRRIHLVIEEGSQDFYRTVEAKDDVIVDFNPAIPKKLTEYTEDSE